VKESTDKNESDKKPDGDFGDLLQELRVLLQGVQVLIGFLIVLPFSDGFSRVSESEKKVYLVLFLCVLTALVLFSAPAAQHRLLTPLHDRIGFKRESTRLIVIGMIPFSISIVLATHFVVIQVAGSNAAVIASVIAGTLILMLWWMIPMLRRRRRNALRRANET
jgi:hypothetical protein